MRRFFWRLIFGFVLPLLGFLILLGMVLALIPLSIWYQAEVDETRQADAAVILGAAVYTDHPSPVFMERIRHGIELYQNGLVKKLIFTGGKDRYDEVSEAAAARAVALEEGVAEEDILIEEESTKTWLNLVETVPVMEQADVNSVLVVSDPLHMKRAMVMADDLGIEAYASPTKTSRFQSREAKLKFLKSETIYFAGYIARRILGYEGDWERRDAELIQDIGKEMLNTASPSETATQ